MFSTQNGFADLDLTEFSKTLLKQYWTPHRPPDKLSSNQNDASLSNTFDFTKPASLLNFSRQITPHNISQAEFFWPTDQDTLRTTSVHHSLAPLVRVMTDKIKAVQDGRESDASIAGDIGCASDWANRSLSLALPGFFSLVAHPAQVLDLLTVTCCMCGESLCRTGADTLQDDALGVDGMRIFPSELFDHADGKADLDAIEIAFWKTLHPESYDAWVKQVALPQPGDLARDHEHRRQHGYAPLPALHPEVIVSRLPSQGDGVHVKNIEVSIGPLLFPPENLTPDSSVEESYRAFNMDNLYEKTDLLRAHLTRATSEQSKQQNNREGHRRRRLNRENDLQSAERVYAALLTYHCPPPDDLPLAKRRKQSGVPPSGRKARVADSANSSPSTTRKKIRAENRRREQQKTADAMLARLQKNEPVEPATLHKVILTTHQHIKELQKEISQMPSLATLEEEEDRDARIVANAHSAINRALVHCTRISRIMRCQTPVGIHGLLRECRERTDNLAHELDKAFATRGQVDSRGPWYNVSSLTSYHEIMQQVTQNLEGAVQRVMSRYRKLLRQRKQEALRRVETHARRVAEATVVQRLRRDAHKRFTRQRELEQTLSEVVSLGRLLDLNKRQTGQVAVSSEQIDAVLADRARCAWTELQQMKKAEKFHHVPFVSGVSADEDAGAGRGSSGSDDDGDPPVKKTDEPKDTLPLVFSSRGDYERRHLFIEKAVEQARQTAVVSGGASVRPPPPAAAGPRALAQDAKAIRARFQPSDARGLNRPYVPITCSLSRGGCGTHNPPWSSGRLPYAHLGFSYHKIPVFVKWQFAFDRKIMNGRVSLGFVHASLNQIRQQDAERYNLKAPQAFVKQVIPLPPLSFWTPAEARRLAPGAAWLRLFSQISSTLADIAIALSVASEAQGRPVLPIDLARNAIHVNPQAESTIERLIEVVQTYLATLVRPVADIGMPDVFGARTRELPLVDELRRLKYTTTSTHETLNDMYFLSLERRLGFSFRAPIVQQRESLHATNVLPEVLAGTRTFVQVTESNRPLILEVVKKDQQRQQRHHVIQRLARGARVFGLPVEGVLGPLITAPALGGQFPMSITGSVHPDQEDILTDARHHGITNGKRLVVDDRLVPGLEIKMTGSPHTVACFVRFPNLLPEATHALPMVEVSPLLGGGAGFGSSAEQKAAGHGDFDGDTENAHANTRLGDMLAAVVVSGTDRTTLSDQASGSLINAGHDTCKALYAASTNCPSLRTDPELWAELMSGAREIESPKWANASVSRLGKYVSYAQQQTKAAGGHPIMAFLTLIAPRGLVYPQRQDPEIPASGEDHPQASSPAEEEPGGSVFSVDPDRCIGTTAQIQGGVVAAGTWTARDAAPTRNGFVATVAKDFTRAIALQTLQHAVYFADRFNAHATPGIHPGSLMLGRTDLVEVALRTSSSGSGRTVAVPGLPGSPHRLRRAFRRPWPVATPENSDEEPLGDTIARWHTSPSAPPTPLLLSTAKRQGLRSLLVTEAAEQRALQTWRDTARETEAKVNNLILQGAQDTSGCLGRRQQGFKLQCDRAVTQWITACNSARDAHMQEVTDTFARLKVAGLTQVGVEKDILLMAPVSGAKGSIGKLTACVGAVGGCARGGKLLPLNVDRRLSSFQQRLQPGELPNPDHYGYITRSFAEGLSPADVPPWVETEGPLIAAASVQVFEAGKHQADLARALADHVLLLAGVVANGCKVSTLLHTNNDGFLDATVTTPTARRLQDEGVAAVWAERLAEVTRRSGPLSSCPLSPHAVRVARAFLREYDVYGHSLTPAEEMTDAWTQLAELSEIAAASRLVWEAAQLPPRLARVQPTPIPHLVSLMRRAADSGPRNKMLDSPELVSAATVHLGLNLVLCYCVQATFAAAAPDVVAAARTFPPPAWLWALFEEQQRDFVWYLLEEFHPYQMRRVYRLSHSEFEQLINWVLRYYLKSRADLGKRVGAIASSYVSEENTQDKLDTKHAKGSQGMTKSMLETVLYLLTAVRNFRVYFRLRKHDAGNFPVPAPDAPVEQVARFFTCPPTEGLIRFVGCTKVAYEAHPAVVRALSTHPVDSRFVFVDLGARLDTLPPHVLVSSGCAALLVIDEGDLRRRAWAPPEDETTTKQIVRAMVGQLVGEILRETTVNYAVTAVLEYPRSRAFDGEEEEEEKEEKDQGPPYPLLRIFVRALVAFDPATGLLDGYTCLPRARKAWATAWSTAASRSNDDLATRRSHLLDWLKAQREAWYAKTGGSPDPPEGKDPNSQPVEEEGKAPSVHPPNKHKECTKTPTCVSSPGAAPSHKSRVPRVRNGQAVPKRRKIGEARRASLVNKDADPWLVLGNDGKGDERNVPDPIASFPLDPESGVDIPRPADAPVAGAEEHLVFSSEPSYDSLWPWPLVVPLSNEWAETSARLRIPELEKTKEAISPAQGLAVHMQALGSTLAAAATPRHIFSRVEQSAPASDTCSPTFCGHLLPSANRLKYLAAFLALPYIEAASVDWPDQYVIANLFGSGARIKLHNVMLNACMQMSGNLRPEHIETTIDRLCYYARPLSMSSDSFTREQGIDIFSAASAGHRAGRIIQNGALVNTRSQKDAVLAAVALGRASTKRTKIVNIHRSTTESQRVI